MRRLIRISLAVVIGVGLLSGGIWFLIRSLGATEVLYRGKSRFEWSEQLSSQSATASNMARFVLEQDIIPHLTRAMFEDTNDSSFKMVLVEKLNTLPGVNIVFLTADSRRSEAALTPGLFGPAAEAAVPALVRALQGHDPAVRGHAAVSLGQIHASPASIIPMLIGYLEQEDVRESAAEALGDYGTLSKPALPKLLSLYEIRDKDLHHAVVEALEKIDPDAAADARNRAAARPAAPASN